VSGGDRSKEERLDYESFNPELKLKTKNIKNFR